MNGTVLTYRTSFQPLRPPTLPLTCEMGLHVLISGVGVWLKRGVGKCLGAGCHGGVTGTR